MGTKLDFTMDFGEFRQCSGGSTSRTVLMMLPDARFLPHEV